MRPRSLQLCVPLLALLLLHGAVGQLVTTVQEACGTGQATDPISKAYSCNQILEVHESVTLIRYAALPSTPDFNVILSLLSMDGSATMAVAWAVPNPNGTWAFEDFSYLSPVEYGQESVLYINRNALLSHKGFAIVLNSRDALSRAWLTIQTSYVPYMPSMSDHNQAIVTQFMKDCCTGGLGQPCKRMPADVCSVPPNLCNEKGQLVSLHLPAAGLECKVPSYLQNLTALTMLSLPFNNIGGSLSGTAKALSGMKNLSTVVLTGNDIDGELSCDELDAMPAIKRLDVTGNKISGTVPQCFVDNLEVVSIGWNALTGSFPQPSASSKVRNLIALHNGFDGEAPTFASAPQLEVIWLSDNNFTGSLPPVPQNIKQVDFGYNHFAGSIPTSYGTLSSLSFLVIPHNELQGVIPISIAQTKSLEFVDVSVNGFSGPLRDTWTSGSLYYVNASYNEFSSTLPPSLASLPLLIHLDLNNNQLTGNLNAFSAALNANTNMLQSLLLANNSITGTIPYAMANISLLIPSPMQLQGLSAGILDLSGTKVQGSFPKWLLKRLFVTKSLFLDSNIALSCPSQYPATKDLGPAFVADLQYRLQQAFCADSNGKVVTMASALQAGQSGAVELSSYATEIGDTAAVQQAAVHIVLGNNAATPNPVAGGAAGAADGSKTSKGSSVNKGVVAIAVIAGIVAIAAIGVAIMAIRYRRKGGEIGFGKRWFVRGQPVRTNTDNIQMATPFSNADQLREERAAMGV